MTMNYPNQHCTNNSPEKTLHGSRTFRCPSAATPVKAATPPFIRFPYGLQLGRPKKFFKAERAAREGREVIR